jgi:molybdate transport system permease protein
MDNLVRLPAGRICPACLFRVPQPDLMSAPSLKPHRASSDAPFWIYLVVVGGAYALFLALLLAADVLYSTPQSFRQALAKPEIQYAIRLTLISCTISAILSVQVALPLGYLLARFRFPGRWLLDALLDIPIVLPPLVIGLSLLILFHVPLGDTNLEKIFQKQLGLPITFQPISVVIAQFAVAAAFAVRTMRITFEQISPRAEDVALTLGASRGQAFLLVALPQAWRGIITAFTLAWARSLGEFGPILVFSGSTRMRTEVLSTTVFLELSVGELKAAVAVSLLMVAIAMIVLLVVRFVGGRAA